MLSAFYIFLVIFSFPFAPKPSNGALAVQNLTQVAWPKIHTIWQRARWHVSACCGLHLRCIAPYAERYCTKLHTRDRFVLVLNSIAIMLRKAYFCCCFCNASLPFPLPFLSALLSFTFLEPVCCCCCCVVGSRRRAPTALDAGVAAAEDDEDACAASADADADAAAAAAAPCTDARCLFKSLFKPKHAPHVSHSCGRCFSCTVRIYNRNENRARGFMHMLVKI